MKTTTVEDRGNEGFALIFDGRAEIILPYTSGGLHIMRQMLREQASKSRDHRIGSKAHLTQHQADNILKVWRQDEQRKILEAAAAPDAPTLEDLGLEL